ncbi:pre-mRNA-splicing factor cwc22 [Diaporthe helianthi]|uniref:Pre-mRNA-splicing factor CWC22 n=1 Tax=Diaporthe helianthi TaxID=158607 RepID=A0A2P5IC57_DIAHE|nr:pre-mRNA-splicing factor cwc22 [Diaporthe helianthi]
MATETASVVSDRHLDERSPNRVPRSPPRRRYEDDGPDDRDDDRAPVRGGRDREREREHDQPRRKGGDSYRPDRPPRGGREQQLPRRERAQPPVPTEEQKQAAAKAEYDRLINARSGGTYIPPARLRALQAQITDKTTKEWQRMAWEALKKSINGLINKANSPNLKLIVPELFNENLVRGRGLFCQSIMKAQAASLPFTPIYAAMVAIVNTKLPAVGELLVKRLVLRFRKAFRRNDKAVCLSTTAFLAHLTNFQVVSENLVAQILILLLHKPSDDSVEIAVNLTREVGQFLEEMNASIARVLFDQFRNILHDSAIEKRVQYQIEVLFQQRKDKFKDNPSIKEELDLVEEEDQITHNIELHGELDGQDSLNIFKYDAEYEQNEDEYKKLKAEILGEGSDDEDDSDDEDESSESEDEEQKAVEIKDQSNADLVNLRRTIYLTLMSSADYEESVHKLLRIQIPPGLEMEIPEMVVECCSQEKTYTKFYGGIGERLAKINRMWNELFETAFADYYEKIHRYDSNKLRNIARLFGHMFGSDAIAWHCLSIIHLNEEETTSASRIFIKILFQEISEEIGLKKLQARCRDPLLQPSLEGIFPRGDDRRNIRFSINYFTSIGMGALTEDMREYLQSLPPPALPAPARAAQSDSDSASSYSSYTGSSYSRSPSRSPSRSRSRSRTPPRRAIDRRRSYSRSVTPARRNHRERSYSRDRSLTRSISTSRSRSPPPRRDARDGGRGRSITRSPPPRRAPARGRSPSRSSRSYSSGGSRSRSRSRSRSPPPPSPPPPPPPPPPRRAAARRSMSGSRSPSPPPRRRPAARSPSPSRSRSRTPPPARRGGADSYRGRSFSRSPSRSRSPPRRAAAAGGGGGAARQDNNNTNNKKRSLSRSASPPRRRARRNSSSDLSDAPPPRGERKRRNSSSSVESERRRKYRRSG